MDDVFYLIGKWTCAWLAVLAVAVVWMTVRPCVVRWRRRAASARARALLECQHPREHLHTGCTLEFHCLTCGNVRHVAHAWQGVTNRKARRHG